VCKHVQTYPKFSEQGLSLKVNFSIHDFAVGPWRHQLKEKQELQALQALQAVSSKSLG